MRINDAIMQYTADGNKSAIEQLKKSVTALQHSKSTFTLEEIYMDNIYVFSKCKRYL